MRRMTMVDFPIRGGKAALRLTKPAASGAAPASPPLARSSGSRYTDADWGSPETG
jgi:hypothetical protein